MLIDPRDVEAKITANTRAIIAVDYAGQPCDYDALRALARRHRLALVADACHSLGGTYKGRPVGTLADLNIFSLHPVKAMTTGEGGMITCASFETAHAMRRFRNHGITSDHFQREQLGSWLYDMVELGYNYRMSDIQCALGLSQTAKLSRWIDAPARNCPALRCGFQGLPGAAAALGKSRPGTCLSSLCDPIGRHYLTADRRQVFAALRAEGIGVNVHYLPVHFIPITARISPPAPAYVPMPKRPTKRFFLCRFFPR